MLARSFEDLVTCATVREARREEKQMTTAGGVNKQMGKEKPDLHDENTKSTLKTITTTTTTTTQPRGTTGNRND